MKHKPIATQTRGVDLVWLLGQPHLGDYLEFVASKTVGGRAADPRKLADEWRTANDLYYELEQSEAGIADSDRLRADRSGARAAGGRGPRQSLVPLFVRQSAGPISRGSSSTSS